MKPNLSKEQIKHFIQCVLEEVEIIGLCDKCNENSNIYPDIEKSETWDELVKHFQSVIKLDETICPECYKIITDEEFTGVNESRSDYGSEFIITSFTCSNCGYKEEY